MTLTEPVDLSCAYVWTDKFGLSQVVHKKNHQETISDAIELIEHGKNRIVEFNRPFVLLSDVRQVKSIESQALILYSKLHNEHNYFLAEAVLCDNSNNLKMANEYKSYINEQSNFKIFIDEKEAQQWLCSFLNLEFNVNEPIQFESGLVWTNKAGISNFICSKNFTLKKIDIIELVSHLMDRVKTIDRKLICYIDLRKLIGIEPDALAMLVSPEFSNYFSSVAYCINTASQRIFSKQLISNTSHIPQQIFENEMEAYLWLKQFV